MRSLACLAVATLLAGGLAAGVRPAGAASPPHDAQVRAVVAQWSARLNAGDYAGVARLFTLPAVMIQGPYGYRMSTRKQVQIWHRALPCGGKVVAVEVAGRYATTTFRLADRAGSKCDAPGELAAARFTIVDGRIRAWRQVAVPEQGPVA